MTIRLLIADDHAWVREGLRYAFHNTKVEIVAEATSGETAVCLALEQEIDVVLLDIRMQNGDGIDALGRIKSVKQKLPVLIYSAHDRPDYIQHCADLGASGYLIKGVDKQTLLQAILTAAAGQPIWDEAGGQVNATRHL